MATPNKALNTPANGSNINTWDVPVNANFTSIDSALGGVTNINAVAASGTVALVLAQYTPPNIVIAGALTANVNYQIPSGIGGVWSVYNNTSGSYTITISSAAGGPTVVIPQGYRLQVVADGTANGVMQTTTSAGSAAGSNTQIQYNNLGSLGGSTMTYNNATGAFSIAAPSSGTTLSLIQAVSAAAITMTDGSRAGQIDLSASNLEVGTTSAHGVSLFTNSASRLTINSTGNATFAAPSSGVALRLQGVAGSPISVIDGPTTSSYVRFERSGVSNGYIGSADSTVSGGASGNFSIVGAGGLVLGYGAASTSVTISSSGNVTINAPSSGVPLTINGIGSTLNLNGAGTSAQYARAQNTGGSALFGAESSTGGGIFVGAPAYAAAFGSEGATPTVIGSNSLERIRIATAGNVTINAPSSGATLALAGATTSTSNVLSWTGNTTGGAFGRATNTGGDLLWGIENSAGTGLVGSSLGAYSSTFGSLNATSVALFSNSVLRVSIGSAGNVIIAAPSSGTTLALTSVASGTPVSYTDGTVTGVAALNASRVNLGAITNHGVALLANNTAYLSVAAAGNVTVAAPSSGVALTVSAVSGTHSTKIADSANTSYNAGFLEVPQNAQNGSYTCVLADSGKHLYHSDSSAYTYTIPANGSVAYPVGTVLTFVNDASAAANITIAITTDTLVWEGTGGTGSRTLGRYGKAVALKVSATRWWISGSNLT